MSPNPSTTPESHAAAVSVEPTALPRGKVYFEVAIDGSLPGELRQKLSLAAYAKIQELDPDAIRADWQNMEHVQNDPAKMPDFIRNRCLYALGSTSRVRDCLVTQDDPPTTNYCYDDTTRICYHPFALHNPDTGLPLEVHASHGGVEGTAAILLVLAWQSEPIFPGPATLDRQKLARFEAEEADTDATGKVTGWPDSFRRDRSARPENGGTAGTQRREGPRSWIDFAAGETLAFDTEDGLAADYTLMMELRGASTGDAESEYDVFRAGTQEAGIAVTVTEPGGAGATWKVTAKHWTAARRVELPVELDADGYHVVTLQVSRDDGVCVFVDAERVAAAADWQPAPALGSSGPARLGCHAGTGQPAVSLGEILLFREPIWEETRVAVARYLANSYGT